MCRDLDEDPDAWAHGTLPDPQEQLIDELARRVAELEVVVKSSRR